MGNLDFAHRAGFSWYCLFLMASGIAMVLVAVLTNQTTQRRAVRALFGIGYFGYGFYLAFISGGGSYFVFYYVFIVPVLLIVGTFNRRQARRQQPQPPVTAGMSGIAGPNLQPMIGLQPMADPGVPPVPDPGLPPMADPGPPPVRDPGLPPMPPS